MSTVADMLARVALCIVVTLICASCVCSDTVFISNADGGAKSDGGTRPSDGGALFDGGTLLDGGTDRCVDGAACGCCASAARVTTSAPPSL